MSFLSPRGTIQRIGLCRLRRQLQWRALSNDATPSRDEISRARDYCLNLLRTYDRPSYTLQAFIPASARDAYLALRSLNLETARVADLTSTSTVGAMRMQFWRDAIARALAHTPPKEPVVVLLAHANAILQQRTEGTVSLSKVWLDRLIKEREKYLSNPPYVDMASLEAYAENTYSTLLYLTLQSLPVQSVTADHVASHIGKATGIVAVLRGLPLLAFPPPPNKHSNQSGFGVPSTRQGVVTLPLDVMAETGVREEDVLRQGGEAPGLKDAVFQVATRANDQLITAREMLNNLKAGRDVGHEFEHADERTQEHTYGTGDDKVSKQLGEVVQGFGPLMQAVPTAMWLERLEKCDFDVFDQRLLKSDWKLPWRAYWKHRRRQLY